MSQTSMHYPLYQTISGNKYQSSEGIHDFILKLHVHVYKSTKQIERIMIKLIPKSLIRFCIH